MPLDLSLPTHLTRALGPDLLLLGGGMVLMLFAAWRTDGPEHQRRVGLGSLVLCALTLVAVVMYARSRTTAGPGVIAVDAFRWASDVVFLIAAIIAIALAVEYNDREDIGAGESHVLVVFATGGMMLMAAARDLMVLFLGIELMSVAVYALAGLNRRSNKSAESALKYFLLGAFSTGFLLYGIALVYGATGSTNLTTIGERIAALSLGRSPMLIIGIAMLLVGFAFKVAAAPFHMWAPDVYEGAPTPITGFMAAGVKAGAFAAFLRVWLEAFGGAYGSWHRGVWWLAALTMIVGNLVALQQRNLKRLLAYSSIAHTGFILVALASGTSQAASAFVFYLIAYTLATMGAFAVVISLGSTGQSRETIEDYHGLWQERPGLAVAMAIFLFGLLGFPIVGGMGFFAKWYVLQAALQAPAPQTRLAVLLVLTTAISAGYYLAVIMAMFMKPRPAGAGPLPTTRPLTRWVIVASAVLLLIFGVWPSPLVNYIQRNAMVGLSPSTPPAAAAASIPSSR